MVEVRATERRKLNVLEIALFLSMAGEIRMDGISKANDWVGAKLVRQLPARVDDQYLRCLVHMDRIDEEGVIDAEVSWRRF